MVRTDEGRAAAWELWRLAKATGTRPSALLNRKLHPRAELAFDLTVMRGHDRFRRDLFEAAGKRAAEQDDFGLNRIHQALRLLYLEV
jgi:hypothetical protein